MMSKDNPAETPRPATAQEITEIVGSLEDSTIAAILATGATRDEVLEAYAWLAADDEQHRRLHSMPHGRIVQLCDILEEEISPPEER